MRPEANLVVDIEQSQVIPARPEEVGTSIVGKHDAVLGSVEDGIVDRQHGCNSQDLLTALVSVDAPWNTEVNKLQVYLD